MTASNRVELQPAFILHTRLYRETSLLVDCLTQDEGRISLIARGARRPKSPYLGLVQPFIPLLISYLGGGELKTLTQAEPNGMCLSLNREQLASGLYLNELCVRLLLPYLPVPELFAVYQETVLTLASDQSVHAPLRIFEKQLLSTLGHDLCLHQDADQQPIDSAAHYIYDPEQGPYRVNPRESMGQIFSGKTLLSLASGDLSDSIVCQESRKLLQSMIKKLLGDKPIMARGLLRGTPHS
jgi:DNA repair protein RecO (recombination protein O)